MVEAEMEAAEGMLIPMVANMNDRRKARKSSINERVDKAVELAMSNDESWMFWVELNDEGDLLEKRLRQLGCSVRQVAGKNTPEQKEQYMMEFVDGEIRVLISKPSVCGSGMNWQHCRNVCFVGINDSHESMFQATNRLWRFGQKQQVNRHLIFSQHEYVVLDNLNRKAEQAEVMWREASKYLSLHGGMATAKQLIEYKPQVEMILPDWLIAEAS
jgi:superfamily II DNA/RNA helicase